MSELRTTATSAAAAAAGAKKARSTAATTTAFPRDLGELRVDPTRGGPERLSLWSMFIGTGLKSKVGRLSPVKGTRDKRDLISSPRRRLHAPAAKPCPENSAPPPVRAKNAPGYDWDVAFSTASITQGSPH